MIKKITYTNLTPRSQKTMQRAFKKVVKRYDELRAQVAVGALDFTTIDPKDIQIIDDEQTYDKILQLYYMWLEDTEGANEDLAISFMVAFMVHPLCDEKIWTSAAKNIPKSPKKYARIRKLLSTFGLQE